MADMNIRNIDPDLLAKVKAKAILEKRCLRDAVIEMLLSYAEDMPIPAGVKVGRSGTEKGISK